MLFSSNSTENHMLTKKDSITVCANILNFVMVIYTVFFIDKR